MRFLFRNVGAMLFGLALAGCGGGGGGGGTSAAGATASNPDGAWLKIAPAPIAVVTTEAGDSGSFQLTAVGSHPIGDSCGVAMSWTKGLLTSDHERGEVTASQYQATFHTDPTLTVGEHLGSLIITLCADDPSVCKSPLPGAPWIVPLQVIVKPSRDASKHVTVAMTPSTPTIVTYPGVVASIDLQGQFGGDTLGKRFQVGIVDPSGVLKVGVWSFDEKGFTGVLTTAKDLVEGDYNGNVEVRLCYDDPYVCRLPAANSPLLVPWKIAVKAPLNLTVLTPVAGLGAWSTYQGNAAHTGFVPASFDVAKFTRRWSVPAPSRYGRDLNGAAIDNGTVFIVRYDAAGGTVLLAISEAAGMQLWRKSFGADVRVNSPAVGNGQVYVTTSGTADTFLWAFDQRTGALLSKTSLSTQLKTYAPPTVAGADLYTADRGTAGDLGKFSGLTGALTWRANAWENPWAPAVDGSYAYAYIGGRLTAVDVATGQDSWTVVDPESGSAWLDGVPVALSDSQAFVANVRNRLMAIDIVHRKVAWTVPRTDFNPVKSQLAFGNDTLYVLKGSGDALEARSPADGQLLWTSDSLGNWNFDRVIVTRNLAFVSTYEKTKAIDLATHKVVWTYPMGGDLSISSTGVLYILGPYGGELVAINLQ